jgi:hypothetical protein
MAGMARDHAPTSVFYRIVRTNPPTLDDFKSAKERGSPPPRDDPELLRLWDGVSVNATAVQSRNRARGLPQLGCYIAKLEVSRDAPILAERTLGRGHYTLWSSAEALLRCVVSVVPVDPVG